MRKAFLVVVGIFILAFNASCAGRRKVPPLLLYSGAPRPAAETSVLRIVGEDHPTLQILKLYRVGTSMDVVYQKGGVDQAWAPPDHFGGLQVTQPQGPETDVRSIPREFHLLPGTYKVEFSYLPVVDRWGWTHKPDGESSTWLECEAGHVYLLEGRMQEDRDGWSLVKLVLVAEDQVG